MLNINTYHGTYNRSWRGGLGYIENFVVHYTGTTAPAKNNCIYFANGNRNASADIFIDPDGTPWEYNNVLDGYYTWGCGDGNGAYGITNRNSIQIEVVNAGGAFTEAQIKTLYELYAHFCRVLGKKLNVVRHYDASRKHCPAYYVNEQAWADLKNRITGAAPQPVDAGAFKAISIPAGKYEVYRLYNPHSGHHFFTSSKGEKDSCVSVGWVYEGVGWYGADTGLVAYRLYNPNDGDHFWTIDYEEAAWLITVGWVYEGANFASAREGVPVYRAYNENNGQHHFVSNEAEYNGVVKDGWKAEGVAFRAIAA